MSVGYGGLNSGTMRSTPTGKHLVLMPRYLTIFQALSQYCYLRST